MGPPRVLYDFYSKEAKRLGYTARSAFKLLELQKRFSVIPRNGRILDLGCHPGAWMQVACFTLGKRGGQVLGVDLQDTEIPGRYCDDRVTVWKDDARSLMDNQRLLEFQPKGFHTVLSDMCPSTAGNASLDALQSLELQRIALQIALGCSFESSGDDGGCKPSGVLLPGGSVVMKLLEGSGSRELGQDLRQHFSKVTWLRPKATRTQSREIFLVGKGRLSGNGGASVK